MIKIVNLAECPQYLPVCANWFFNEWDKQKGRTIDEILYRTKHTVCRSGIPQIHVALDKDLPVGMFSIWNNDLVNRQDLSPWLAGLYVAPDYRGRGVGRSLQQKCIETARECGYEKLYLYTEHENYYEKTGWEFMETAPLHGGEFVRIYQFDIKKRGKQ